MTRRELLAITLAAPAFAQKYRTYSRCLPEYLSALAHEAYERRNAALLSIRTPEDARKRQAWVRQTFWELIGGEPDRTPLNTRTIRSFKREGYTVETIVYESQPGLHIPANLYIPSTGTPPYPGVLFQMGHSLNGKAAEPYQKCCQALAKLGYLVLAFDPMGQGERTYFPRPGGGTLTRLSSADEEHNVPGRQMLLVGDTATRLQTWDAVRSLDVLASHPLVDPKRLASTGQSGGGTLTMFLIAADDRLAAAAVSCGNTENFACADFNPPGSVDDAEQNFVSSGPAGFDRWDTLYPFAPKPLLVLASGRDFFGTYSPSYLTSGREEFEKLQRFYGVFAKEGSVEWQVRPMPHALSHDLRIRIYNFFERHLRDSDRVVSEPPLKPEPEQQLYAGATGNVVRDFGSKTPQQLVQQRVARLRPTGTNPLNLKRRDPAPPSILGRASGETADIEIFEVQSAAKVWVPAYLYLPRRDARSVLLLLEPRGRNAAWREGELYPELAANGHIVCAFDVRGIGDLSPEVGRGNPYYARSHSEEDWYAWASMILGEPLLAQRVTDLLAVVEAVRSHASCAGKPMTLAARDKMTVPALFAAAADKRIDRVYLVNPLKSYRTLLETAEPDHPLANFIPSVLEHTDLPEIEAQVGKRLQHGTRWDRATLSNL